MRKLLVVLLILCCFIPLVSAENVFVWSAYGDAWKATNYTHTIIKWTTTGEHTWLSDGNATNVSYLVVAGGGSGSGNRGGGGGGGGLLQGTADGLSGLTTIYVGAGGSAVTGNVLGNNGTFSSFSTIANATGGGGGGYNQMSGSAIAGKAGGSGGGGGRGGAGGANVTGQGFPGTTGDAGGGGGAGGTNATATYGGIGIYSSIGGTLACYAGGGAGNTNAQYSTCGGGLSLGSNSVGNGTAGTNGLGGGGGASGGNGASYGYSGKGGDGVVIIMFETKPLPPTNFTSWSVYGDAWKSTNATHALVMWDTTGTHTWLSTGNATIVDYLVIAGGGAGGVKSSSNPYSGGGGGAGGMLEGNLTIEPSDITVIVGSGGASSNGQNSSFGSIVAIGGGRGGAASNGAGQNGGSGGGAGSFSQTEGLSLDAAQGNAGGNGFNADRAGGGGGAGAVGGAGTSENGGSGGAGRFSSITGTNVQYAGGGAGSWTGAGGAGGGGNSASNSRAATSGTPNTGGGGGGGYGAYDHAGGGSGVVIILYTTTTVDSIVASFTSSSNPSVVDTAVSFTDASTGSPTTYNWTIDGSITNTTQNAGYIFATAGTYSIDLNVTNSTGYFSNLTLNQVVVDASGFNQQDIYMEGQFVTTFHVIDRYSAPLSNASIQIGSTTLTTDSSGNANYTATYGTYLATFIKESYITKQQSFVVDSDQTLQIIMYSSSSTSVNTQRDLNVLYPHQVRFVLLDTYGNALEGVGVNVSMVNSTFENTNWWETLFGYSETTTPMNTTVLSGITDTEGSVVFPMVASARYRVGMIDSTRSISETKTVYPSESSYTYVLVAGAIPVLNMADYINLTTSASTANATHVNLTVDYTNLRGASDTQSLLFFVDAANGTRLYTTTQTGVGSASISFAARNTRAAGYVWGCYANSSTFGNVSSVKGITMKGSGGKLVNLDPCGGYALGWDNSC